VPGYAGKTEHKRNFCHPRKENIEIKIFYIVRKSLNIEELQQNPI
jgi:hypothetical protein